MKARAEKITMVTCYDYTSAKILAETEIDCLLVGDSVAMTVHGFESTVAATVEMMEMHTAAVKRGAPQKFIVTDLPFLSYRKSLDEDIAAVQKLMRAGANALKLEGVDGNIDLIKHLTSSGVPVMGHIGLTPQFVHALGGYKVQGKTLAEAERLKREAVQLQDAGCFAIVLECVPAELAAQISRMLDIPTIGIGAGSGTDGQVLVLQDLLGLNTDFKPKFVKHFMRGADMHAMAVNLFVKEVKTGAFPNAEHHFHAEGMAGDQEKTKRKPGLRADDGGAA
jgi:3-methyl-2-oxobutanoate hydroxymethyltransferase